MKKADFTKALKLLAEIGAKTETGGIRAGLVALRTQVEGYNLREAYSLIHELFPEALRVYSENMSAEFRELEASPEARAWYRRNLTS